MKKWAFVFYDVKFGKNFSITTLVFCFMDIYIDGEIVILLTHIKCFTISVFASYYDKIQTKKAFISVPI